VNIGSVTHANTHDVGGSSTSKQASKQANKQEELNNAAKVVELNEMK